MTAIPPKQLVEALTWRYATKVFDPTRPIAAETWDTLEQSLILSPSSFGLQPYRFLVVRDQALRKQLLPHSWNQNQVVDCSHYVVFASRTSLTTEEIDRFIKLIANTRNIPADSLAGYRGMMVGALIDGPLKSAVNEWATRQVYIALGNLMTAAALLGVDACPMEGFAPAEYNRLLNLPAAGYSAVVCCALGYRAAADKYASLPKVRFPKDQLIQHIG